MFFFKDKLGRRHIFFEEIGDCSNTQEECVCNDLSYSQDNVEVDENTIEIINLRPENSKSPIKYFIFGEDAEFVTVDGDILKFVSPPDYENPFDSNKDNIFNIGFVAIDADGKALDKTMQIHVRNIEDTANVDNPQQYNEVYQAEFTKYNSGYFLFEFNDGGYIINNSQRDIDTSLGTLQKGQYKNTSVATKVGETRVIDISNQKLKFDAKIDNKIRFKFETDIESLISKIDENDPNFAIYNMSGDLIDNNSENISITNISVIATRNDYSEKPKPNYTDMSANIAEVTFNNLSENLNIKFEPSGIEFKTKYNGFAIDAYDNDGNEIANNVAQFNSQAIFTIKKHI